MRLLAPKGGRGAPPRRNERRTRPRRLNVKDRRAKDHDERSGPIGAA